MARPLYEIANDIFSDWERPDYAALPYLEAMLELTTINDNYGADSAESIVLYFLNNAGKWKGPVAKALKAELNLLVKQNRKRASSQRVVRKFLTGLGRFRT